MLQHGRAVRAPGPGKHFRPGPAARAMPTPIPHPHFDDRGTLSWHRKWADALAEARSSRRKIFIELGREL